MKINLTQDIISDANLVITKIKLDGGSVVNSYDKSNNILGSCFVPDLRTHLAAMASIGVMASGKYSKPEHVAQDAVAQADALIIELNKPTKELG
jgi:hypothetical protein